MDVRQTAPDSQSPGAHHRFVLWLNFLNRDRWEDDVAGCNTHSKMPQPELSSTGKGCRKMTWMGWNCLPQAFQPARTSPIGGLVPSPLGSFRQEIEGTQAQFLCLSIPVDGLHLGPRPMRRNEC